MGLGAINVLKTLRLVKPTEAIEYDSPYTYTIDKLKSDSYFDNKISKYNYHGSIIRIPHDIKAIYLMECLEEGLIYKKEENVILASKDNGFNWFIIYVMEEE